MTEAVADFTTVVEQGALIPVDTELPVDIV